ncbi:MAG: hypothetical protein JXA33_02045 [Anaerolineae bacterium]|nr:hypothetical protein [Anaerolineae bacterium]
MKRNIRVMFMGVLSVMLLLLSTLPVVWAMPGQTLDNMTVPTFTYTPGPTDEPDDPDPTDDPDDPDPTSVPQTNIPVSTWTPWPSGTTNPSATPQPTALSTSATPTPTSVPLGTVLATGTPMATGTVLVPGTGEATGTPMVTGTSVVVDAPAAGTPGVEVSAPGVEMAASSTSNNTAAMPTSVPGVMVAADISSEATEHNVQSKEPTSNSQAPAVITGPDAETQAIPMAIPNIPPLFIGGSILVLIGAVMLVIWTRRR